MPIYDFRCTTCGQVVELLVRASSDPARCPSCDSDSLVRLPSAGHMARLSGSSSHTCCGREERCETSPCGSQGGDCGGHGGGCCGQG